MIRLFQRLGSHSTFPQEDLKPAPGHAGTHEPHPQAEVCNSQVPHTATGLVESVATPDVKQSNAFFNNAQGVNISGNPSFHNQNIINVINVYGGGTASLERLEKFVSFAAQFDSSAQDPQRRCHSRTRKNVLTRLGNWVDNPKLTERISWLCGPAGAGKSAIAQTIAHSYNRPKVAATFFFFRSDANRNDGNRLFPTLAYQLAISMPTIGVHIAKSLYDRPDLPMTGVETQFNQLLAHPFQALSEDATQQLAPAAIVAILEQFQELAPIIVIDGVDECTDENLQRRILQVIGDALTDDRFPLRFLIVSRPELHIEQTISRFQIPILSIDLATLDDANQDIENYLVDEFSRITSKQGLKPTWPGQEIINDIVYKSSGNFILASVIIKFVDDPDSSAETQLNIVRNLKPPTIMNPFAVLDQLFLEILKSVPDQGFLKRYLALFSARIAVSSHYDELYKDDAVLMHVSEKELYAKLRKMRSLLKLEHRIDVHHRSFVDFLHDSSRSDQYHVAKKSGIRQYLGLFVDSLVRYISSVIEQPDHHITPHFTPKFRAMIKDFPPKIELTVNEWQGVIQPLLDLQDHLLQLPNFAFTCDECTIFHLLRELLHLGLHLRRSKGQPNNASVQSVMNVRQCSEDVSSKTEKMDGNGLDSLLQSLLDHLPEALENWTPSEKVINLVKAILCFECVETAAAVHFISDAQKLVNLLIYLIDEEKALREIHPDETQKATLLTLELFARVPTFPPSSFFTRYSKLRRDPLMYRIPIQTIIASRVLDRCYIVPVLMVVEEKGVIFVSGDAEGNDQSMKQWRRKFIPSSGQAIQIMFGLAKAIQYLHSLSVVLYREFGPRDIFLDSSLCPKICRWYSTSRSLLDRQCKERFSLEDNIFSFGCLSYELFSGNDTEPSFSSEVRRGVIIKRTSLPEIPEDAWQLIQRCCAQDPESRPTMNKIVQEMESWK